MIRIAIAGASGYVGRHLLNSIPPKYGIKALSRKEKKSNNEKIKWVEVDLFSFGSTLKALSNSDIAIYLVHSMLPSTRLFQGSFYDTDLMLADNFAKSCKINGVKQIIYLSGVIPKGDFSKHLESRKEVEEVFTSTGIPCTTLRAGLVVGDGGSSFEILKNLSLNLPMMILPKWTKSKTQVIYIDDIINIIIKTINAPGFMNKTLNVTSGENLKYEDLIKLTLNHLDKQIPLIPVPISSTSFSKLWVSIFGHAKYELVSPLVDSLLCDFSEVSPAAMLKDEIKYKSYKSMLKNIKKEKVMRRRSSKRGEGVNNVRSIQRLGEGLKMSAKDVAEEYLKWLPSSTNFLIQVKKNDGVITFYLLGLIPLLVLKYISNLKINSRAKFNVIGGLLSKTKNTGWLEFRTVAKNKYLLASINEFVPSLPWYIYKYTQAPVHKYVMLRFSKYLKSL